MLVLTRRKGQKIEIQASALVRVARVTDHRVRLDITAPFTRNCLLTPNEGPTPDRVAVLRLLDIHQRGNSRLLKAKFGILVPAGATVRRAELAQLATPREKQFPWHRFRPTAHCWQAIEEEIWIALPHESSSPT